MSMNLNIPITQTITLPDSWQACKTPQELSYWIIAKFDNFTTQFTEINNAMSALQSMIETNTDNIATNDAEIAEIKNTLTSINSKIATLQTDYNTLNTDLTTLSGLHHQLSNKVAGMEDAVLDLPGIKNDITELQTITASQGVDIRNVAQQVSESVGIIDTAFNRDYNTYIDYNDIKNNNYRIPLNSARCYSTIFMKVGSVDSRLKIAEAPTTPTIGFTCNLYYYSDNNVTFGTINGTTAGTDISEQLKTYSIDGNTAIADIMAKTTVAIKIFKVDNETRPYAWTLL